MMGGGKKLSWRWVRLFAVAAFAVCASAARVQAKPWKGAEMITQQTFRYGAFEARILAARGSGMITPFFLYKDGSEVAGAQWEELDFEIFGKDGTFQTQVMTPGKNGTQRTEHVTLHNLPTLAWEHYYTYRMEWTPTQLSFYVDGRLIRRETDVVEFGKLLDPNQTEAMRLRVSIWAGDFGWSGAFDQTAVPGAMFVNWIQAYSYTPGAGPNGGDFTLLWRDDLNATDGSRWYWANWTFDVAVNDYIAQNSASRNGYLVQVLTADTATGQFPTPPVDDGSIAQPAPPPDAPPPPATGPFALPARIEAEAFARFFDTTGGNYGDAVCGTTDVDVQLTSDPADPNCNVGWTDPGEWLEYDLTVASAATYDLTLRVASVSSGQTMHVEIDGVNVSGARASPGAGFQSFADVVVPSVRLSSGAHVLRLVFDNGQININYVEFKTAAAPAAAVPIPATIQAEAFHRFFDTTPGNFGDAACGTTAVDVQTTSDTGGGCNVGWTDAGEWLEYDVSVASAGSFDLTLRVASAIAGQTLHAEIDGQTVGSGPLTVAANGWQAFQSLVIPSITLSAGNHIVRLVFDTGSVNVNYLAFAAHGGTAPPPPPPQTSCTPVSTTYQAETMSATTGGPATGGWNIWSNGSLSASHTFRGGNTTIRVSASGQSAAGIWPHMLVKVGSQTVGDTSVSTTAYAVSSFPTVATAGTQTVSITFDNDAVINGQDRNLIVDAVTIDECTAP